MIDTDIYDTITELLKDTLVTDENGAWCFEKTHYSGHYSDWLPIQYLDEDDFGLLEDMIWDDFNYDNPEFDWEDFHGIFEDIFYKLVDENISK